MHHRRRAVSIAIALAAVVSLPVHAAAASPPDPLVARFGSDGLSLADEHAFVVRQAAAARTEAAARWAAAVEFQRAVAFAAALDRARAQERAPAPRRSRASAPAVAGSGACGGNLPPCYVMQRESGGSLTAQNPVSTASGKWQFLDSTWHSVTGLPGSASDYDEATQDAAAAKAWAGGAGCSHWSAC